MEILGIKDNSLLQNYRKRLDNLKKNFGLIE